MVLALAPYKISGLLYFLPPGTLGEKIEQQNFERMVEIDVGSPFSVEKIVGMHNLQQDTPCTIKYFRYFLVQSMGLALILLDKILD